MYAVYECSQCNQTKKSVVSTTVLVPDVGEYDDIGDNSIVAVTPETAQDVMDHIGDGSFVIFKPGTYSEKLTIRTSVTQSEVQILGDFSGTEDERYMSATKFLEYETTSPDDLWVRGIKAYRELSDVLLYALDGAVFTGGFEISLENGYDYIRGKESDGENYMPYILIKNLTLQNWTFKESNIVTSFTRDKDDTSTRFTLGLYGFTVKDCRFNGDASTQIEQETGSQAITTAANVNEGTLSDFLIDGCVFDHYYQGLYTGTMKNGSVIGCTFENIIHNAIAFQGGDPTNNNAGDTNNTGSFIIRDNTFRNVSDRVIGRGGFKNAEIEISGNRFFASGDDTGEIVKFGGSTTQHLTDVTIEFFANYEDGRMMENKTVRNLTDTSFVI